MKGITHRTLLVFVIGVGFASLVAMAVLWPGARPPVAVNPAQTTELVNATLLDVSPVDDADTTGLTPGAQIVAVRARVESTGEVVEFETTDETGSLYEAGQRVRLASIQQEGLPTTYFISDFRRSTPLLVLVALFIAAVVWFGRLQGVRALVGLVITFGLILLFIVPAILDGSSPLTVSIVGSVLIMVATLYLSHGFSAKTTAAVVGTCVALLFTGLLALAFVSAASITGFASEEARLANVQLGGISLRGLVLAGIVIGGLGVLDDVTMSQSSTVFQLHRVNPQLAFAPLVRNALSVGRDHIAATVNTLFLAYAGASLPLLILFAGSPDALGTVVTSETVAVEIVRTLVGSIGLIAAVPLTTALAAALVLGEPSRSSRARRPASRREPQERPPLRNPDVGDGADDGWEERLREAYRLPPDQETR